MTDVIPLLDAEGTFSTFRESFDIDDDRPWRLPFRAFLVRGDGWTALVDTGVGPPGDDPFLPDRDARLPDALGDADVDVVVLTHLHPDHVGWNMVEGRPYFRDARYVAHRADYDHFATARPDRPYIRDQLVALHATGRLELFGGAEHEVLPGLSLTHAPGHTPGHCIVHAGDVVILGDLAVHELQLRDLDVAYVAEHDPAAAAAARRRLLPELAAAGAVVAIGHLEPPLGRLRAVGDGFAWHALD